MPVESSGVTVGTSITAVSGPYISSKIVYLQSGTEGALTYVGGSDVSASTGILLSETNNAVFQTNADDSLYCISDTAGAVVKVLEVK
jgi:DNA-binding beta-propeller fold protein YncE